MSEKYFFFDLDNTLYNYNNAHLPAQDTLVEFLSSQLKLKHQKVSSGLETARVSVKERLGSTASSHNTTTRQSNSVHTVD